MELGSTIISVLVEFAVCVETRERGRIGHPCIEVADFFAPAPLAPRGISGLSTRLWPLTFERQRRQAIGLPPEAERGAQCIPEAVSCIILNASSRVKVLGFWMGGKSLNVAAHCAASACAP